MTDRLVLSGYAAKLTDHLILKGDNGNLASFIFFESVLARLVSTVVFPIFAGLDFIGHGLRAIGERIWAIGAKDKEAHIQEARERLALAGKSLAGVFGSVLAIPSFVDVVSFHFLPPDGQKGVVEPYGKLYRRQVDERSPKTLEEVQRIVKEAKWEGKKIGIAGARMSQGEHILPSKASHIFIDTKGLNKIQINPHIKTAKIQAGATWCELQEAANKFGLAPKVQQASNIFRVGGSLSADCHGWDHKAGSLVNVVRSLTIVDADGHKQVVYPDDELFRLAIGGYGLFGVIVEAEIELTDNLTLQETGERVAIKDYVKYFDRKILPNKDIAMHLYRLSLNDGHLLQSGVAVSYLKRDEKRHVAKLVDEEPNGTFLDRFLLHIARRRSYFRKLYWSGETKRIDSSGTVATRNEIMRPPIKAALNSSRAQTEWLQEYFVRGKDLEPFLRKLGSTLRKNNMPVINASVRYVKHDTKAEMAYAKKGRRFAIVLFFNQSLASKEVETTRKWVREIDDWLGKREGTFYLPYAHLATKEQFRKCYPQWKNVVERKKYYDPDETFSSGFYQAYFK